MARLTITPEDHLKGAVVKPGLYKVEVVNVEEKASKTDGSQNWNVEMKILDGEYKGVSIYKTFNEKAAGFAIAFVEALGGKIDKTKNFDVDFKQALHAKLRADVKNQLYEGTMKNQVVGFLPMN